MKKECRFCKRETDADTKWVEVEPYGNQPITICPTCEATIAAIAKDAINQIVLTATIK